MVDPETGTASLARNTNLNEDLGKVEYVFSDKTGTLTANEMQLREVAIKGVAYGDASFRCWPSCWCCAPSCCIPALAWSPALGAAEQGHHGLLDLRRSWLQAI